MTTGLAVREHTNGAAPIAVQEEMVTPEHRKMLREMILKGGTDAQVDMVILVCNRYGMDPFLGHINLIQGKLFVTHKGLMHVAHASKQFDGINTARAKDEFGEYFETTVYRKDMTHPFVGRIYANEYSNTNPVWKSHRAAMGAKTAESFVLRRAFDVALASAEEMGRNDTDAEIDNAPRPALSGATDAPRPELIVDETATIHLEHRQAITGIIKGFDAADRKMVQAHMVEKYGGTEMTKYSIEHISELRGYLEAAAAKSALPEDDEPIEGEFSAATADAAATTEDPFRDQ